MIAYSRTRVLTHLLPTLSLLVGCNNGTSGCFAAGTLVATPSGSVPIEQLYVGDRVLSFSPNIGLATTATITRRYSTLRAMTYRLGLGDRQLVVTADHPVYSLAHRTYIRADELQAGDALLVRVRRNDASPVAVNATLVPLRRQRVYNITVEPTHNYFADGVLVHNKEPPLDVAIPDETARDTTRDFTADVVP